MISFHRDTENLGNAKLYKSGWEPANLDEPERIALGVSRFPWSGIQWYRGERHQKNFGRAAWCVLDFDDSALTLEQACKIFCDSVHIIGTTKSHQIDKGGIICDRFRVALKFHQPIEDLETYRATMRYYISKYDADPACVDGARFFWPCTAIISVNAEGYTQETILPTPREPVDYSAFRAEKDIPRWIQGLFLYGCPDLKRNTTCYRIGANLIQCGFSEDEIVDLIMASPIPIGPHVKAEVAKAVGNGAKAGREEMLEQER